MKIAGITHWIGVLLLLVSALLLLFATLSAPIINDNGLLRVTLTNATLIRRSSVSFGTFGYCLLDVLPVNSDQDWCTGRHIGYRPAEVMAAIDQAPTSDIASGTSDGLTGVMVLHPIACALAFVAFVMSTGASVFGSLIGALIALLAWILTLLVMAADFSMWGVLRHHIDHDGSGSHAFYGSAIWCVLAAFITLFFGMTLVLFTFASNRRETRRRQQTAAAAAAEAPPRRKMKRGIF